MISEPVCVAPTGDRCGEGVIWHEAHAAVYWTDINRFLIHRFDLLERSVRSWFFPEPVTALALTERDDTLVVALGSSVILWKPETDHRYSPFFRLDDWPFVRLNDCRADPRGSFWAGSMRNNVKADGSSGEAGGQDGVLYRIDSDGRTTIQRQKIGISNTLAWSPDRRRFYFGDSLANVIWVYDYDPVSGDIGNERPFLDNFPRGLPDGSSVDSEGFLWNCRYGGGCIVRVGPDGRIDQIIEMPVSNVTTCTFGGSDLKTLYITSAAIDAAPSDRLAGGLFALQSDVPGQAENKLLKSEIRN
jgi:sugar lactone lactonase YvrE